MDSALKECPKCLTKEQITTLRKFVANRSSKEGKEFVLTHKLQERMNFMAAFQLLGAYDKYYYSVKDVEKRSFLADNHWLGEISRREKAGQASAIDIKEGYQQYVAYYDTNSAFFLGFQYLKMYGDLLDIAVANKAINESQRILSKNFKKVWGKGIKSKVSTIINKRNEIEELLDEKLIQELKDKGVKFTEEDLIWVFKNKDGKIIFLEKGKNSGGFQHILKHKEEFLDKGIFEEDLAEFIMESLKNGKIVGKEGSRFVYEYIYKGIKQTTAITVSSNGFVVGANPVSKFKKL